MHEAESRLQSYRTMAVKVGKNVRVDHVYDWRCFPVGHTLKADGASCLSFE